MSDLLQRETVKPGLVRVTLNRPEAFNSLSEGMLAALKHELDTLAKDDNIKVVILAGAGKAFCAGHDLKEMRAAPSQDYYEGLFKQCSEVMLGIQRLPQVVIAQVEGVATAAGCQLVAMCDLAVAAESAKFAVSGVNLGLFCSTPSVALSRNIGRKEAMYMLVTGEFISSDQARDWGLINEVVAKESVAQATEELADKILKKPAPALRLGKRLFYEQIETNIARAYELAGQTMACNMMDETALEGVQAFIEKRSPNWQK
ncbi:MAG: enoyl-CoA hydratase [Burkholderiaceae bacterium]|nr:enoyl-CoA hydratase [Burkholderiaceae bacterium]MCD8516523.1 enoyl-CoA hydratase [Burkholderiaceae bacterium]MCD8536190.1 enoyl-CoA hydratase [Burkholderiaceae bacterium]MCD8564821.1 enoyl-CoA hydratase [Burkholderiaceae bacterium]